MSPRPEPKKKIKLATPRKAKANRPPPREVTPEIERFNQPTSSPDPLTLSQDSPPHEPIREASKRRRMPKPAKPSLDGADATPRAALSSSIEVVGEPAQPVASTSKSPPVPPPKPESELVRMMRKYPERATAPLTAEEWARRAMWREIAEQPTQVRADRYLDFGASPLPFASLIRQTTASQSAHSATSLCRRSPRSSCWTQLRS